MTADTPLRLAIIGCSAVSERGHSPAAALVPQARITALVDTDAARARRLADRHPGAQTFDDYRGVLGQIDAAIVALPPSLHAAVSIDLLERGVHVLVEKPMASSTAECDAMIAAARRSGAVLAVGLVRRFSWPYRFAKRIIDAGSLGPIQSFDVHEGGVFNWPSASPYFLKKELAGGGVLADAGAHVIDALLWWFGDIGSLGYFDDELGGVEADCELDVMMSNGVRGRVELSRTRAMRNTTIIRGACGSLEIHAFRNAVTLCLPDGGARDLQLVGELRASAPGSAGDATDGDMMAEQLADFAGSIRGRRPPTVTGEEGRRSVQAIEACYAQRQRLRHPWVFEGVGAGPLNEGPARREGAGSRPPLHEQGRVEARVPIAVAEAAAPPFAATRRPIATGGAAGAGLAGRTVLVTGATGFIGGRLLERLVLEHGVTVRALVRDFRKASRLGRFGVSLIPGDLTDPAAVRQAAEGSDLIFHCAFGSTGTAEQRRAATVDGIRHVVAAALAARVPRLVHLSTLSAYGHLTTEEITEDSPRRKTGVLYADTKLEAEEIVLHAHRRQGLAGAVIQPTVVYGPFGGWWTAGQIDRLRRGRFALADDGAGACNAVYVDDVVQAAFLAAVADDAVGQTFLVSGLEPVTWKEY